MRILIVDNNIMQDSWGAPELRKFAASVSGAIVETRRAPANDLPSLESLSRFDRFVISGSLTSCLEEAPWITRVDETIRRALDLGRPLLGVCYGHQALARVVGGKSCVRRGTTPEFGWTKISVQKPSKLLEGLPDTFFSFSSHFEEVSVLPPGMHPLASSPDCAYQAMQLGDRPVFGIQFHPEKDLDDAKRTLLERKKKGVPKKLLFPDHSEKYYDSSVGEKIFRNFFAA